MEERSLPISEKFTLTIKEASEYFSIGIKNMRRLAEENTVLEPGGISHPESRRISQFESDRNDQ